MKKMHFFVLILFLMSSSACDRDDRIEVKGLIEAQGMTTYQYGSHVMFCEDEMIALYSNNIDLDQYIGTEIVIIGNIVDGYPIDGGPRYVEVIRVKD